MRLQHVSNKLAKIVVFVPICAELLLSVAGISHMFHFFLDARPASWDAKKNLKKIARKVYSSLI